MSLSMYQASVPVLLRELDILAEILKIGAENAKSRNIDESVMLNLRLAPDMLPFARQIQITCDVAKGGAARLAGVEVPSFPDNETTFAELQARIKKTQDFVASCTAKQIDGGEAKPVHLTVAKRDMKFKAQEYLFEFALPNVFFHISIAYAILRHNGVPLGKMNYLGNMSAQISAAAA